MVEQVETKSAFINKKNIVMKINVKKKKKN